MGDSMYSEFLLDVGGGGSSGLKQETAAGMPLHLQEMGPSSASVPIPGGHRGGHSTYDDQFSPSPLANPALWGSSHPGDLLLESNLKLEMQDNLDPLLSFRMDDEDIFQVDKADLIQGPTLAELNANEDTLLGDLNFDDLLLPDENMQPIRPGPPAELLPTSNSLLSAASSAFAPSSFPQPVQGFRNVPQYTSMTGFGFNSAMGIGDPAEAISPPAFPSPGTSNAAGLSTCLCLSLFSKAIHLF